MEGLREEVLQELARMGRIIMSQAVCDREIA
jgi:hypothetical protein